MNTEQTSKNIFTYVKRNVRTFVFRRTSILVNQYLPHNLGYQQKIQVIRRNQVYLISSNVSTDTTVLVKD